MHEIRVSEGVVLQKRPVGEANSLVYVLTKDLGLIRAQARSSRVEESKLRYGLEPLTTGRYSFVRGRREWRLTGVEKVSNEAMGKSIVRRQAAGRISKLLLRLVQGEEPLPELYHAVASGLAHMADAESDSDAQAIETVLVLRILAQLGYLPRTPELAPFIADHLFTIELAAAAAERRNVLIRAINESLQHTGL